MNFRCKWIFQSQCWTFLLTVNRNYPNHPIVVHNESIKRLRFFRNQIHRLWRTAILLLYLLDNMDHVMSHMIWLIWNSNVKARHLWVTDIDIIGFDCFILYKIPDLLLINSYKWFYTFSICIKCFTFDASCQQNYIIKL